MDPNAWTFENRENRQNNDFRLHEDRYDTELFSSPASLELDALPVHHELPRYWNNTAFQGASYVRSPSPSARLTTRDGHSRRETQLSGFPTRIQSHVQNELSNYNMHLDRSEVSRTHHLIDTVQHSSRLPGRSCPGDRASGYRATAGAGDITRNGFGWKLRPVSELPDRFRGVFKFGMFNAIQSACFDQVLHSEENLVISAPTGSGKTVLFELSIIRMLTQTADDARSAKCIYVAPTKALCAEKYNEWTTKFGGLGIKCCELTGDTLLLGRGVWGDAKASHIIVTTAEKWDSLTRNWADHSGILSLVKLFLVDEVHVLNESRGSTLEVIISRMKARGRGTRFLLVSATVPNVEDVACWIGRHDGSDQPARIFQFGEEFRPCKLTKFVYGVAKSKGQNDFAYARILDLRLFSVIQQHSTNKPILVFCPTRKGTLDAARQLAKDYEQAKHGKNNLPWPPPAHIHQKFYDKDLPVLASVGIAVHHAGLNTDDRRAVEELFLRKALRVLVATSTLAVGINLPAQMVVIKGVKLYQNGEMREYSDIDIMQMMGRAGRPQFDDEGIAIILCEPELEHKYRTLAQGNTTLESSLHQNLAEHVNSEIGLGTISTVEGAKEWLRDSFFFRRIQKNPRYYDIGKGENQTWEEKVDEIVMKSICSLRDMQLIEYTERDGKLSSTEYGDIMSKFYIRQPTMRAILHLPLPVTMREILELVSVSEEASNLKLRSGEKPMYEKIRRHSDIRFPPKKIVGASDKILLLIQAILAGLPLNSPEFKPAEGQPYLEAVSIFRHATRIVTAIAEAAIINRSGAQLKHALELVRCLNAKAWEDRPLVLRQIEHIGEKSVKVLAENGITSIQKLLQTSPLRIEELLNRRPPFGFEVLAAANEFPRYFLDIKELTTTRSKGNLPVEVEFTIQCGLTFDGSAPQRVKRHRWGKTEMTTLLIVTSDMSFIDFRRIATKALKEKKEFTLAAQLMKPSQSINVYIASENFAGVTVVRTLSPSVPPDQYPTLETRPLTSIEMDLQGLEDVPDFWDIDLDDDDETQDFRTLNSTKRRRTDENSCKVQQPGSNPPVKERVGRDPRKRPDGKYECNHACKDKLKCRHYCCQEGLLEPPRATKRRQQVVTRHSGAKPVPLPRTPIAAKSPQDEQQLQALAKQTPLESRVNPAKRIPTSELLDKMHENANTARDLRPDLTNFGLKVNHPEKSKICKTVPDFDLRLTTLKRSRSPTPAKSAPMDDRCDELPLISGIWGQNRTTSEITIEKCEIPQAKRTKTGDGAGSLEPQLMRRQDISREIFLSPGYVSRERLFLPGSNDEDTADQSHNQSAGRNSTFYCNESYSNDAPDTTVDQFFASGWDTIQPVSSQWHGDDANTHRTLPCSAVDVTTPERGTRGSALSAIRRNNTCALSPSRITGFIRRAGPYFQEQSTNDDTTTIPQGLVPHRGKPPVSGDISSQTHVDPGDLNDTVYDALAEFDCWVASGAVEIIPD